MQRINAQPSFTDLFVSDLGGPRARVFFDRCEAEIPFDRLAGSIAGIFDDQPGKAGAPHWAVVTILKILFVQKCWGMSDPVAEEMLRDRISFRRFVGLSFDDKTPDETVLSKFRTRLLEHGHGSTLFDQSLAGLREKGLVLNNGTLIDATILEAPLGGKRKDGSGCGDPAANKTVKSGRIYHGFRAHVAADRRGIITDFVYDTARVSEHEHFDQLAANETKAVFADSGCRSRERIDKLKARGVVGAFCHRRVRGQKELTAEQKRLNRLVAPIRGVRRTPVRLDQAPDEQPPGALPRRATQRAGLCVDGDGGQLLPKLYLQTGANFGLTREIPCADRVKNDPESEKRGGNSSRLCR